MNLTGGTQFSGELRYQLENYFPEAHYRKAIDQAFEEQAEELVTDGGSRTQYYWSGENGIVYHTQSGDELVDPFFGSVEEAEHYLENRDLTPYSIRHSTATMIAKEADLATAAKQCRHKSKQTTRKYAHSSVDRQSDAINKID